MLFLWFAGLAIDNAVSNHSIFSKSRDRLIVHDVLIELLKHHGRDGAGQGAAVEEHFSFDGMRLLTTAALPKTIAHAREIPRPPRSPATQ